MFENYLLDRFFRCQLKSLNFTLIQKLFSRSFENVITVLPKLFFSDLFNSLCGELIKTNDKI